MMDGIFKSFVDGFMGRPAADHPWPRKGDNDMESVNRITSNAMPREKNLFELISGLEDIQKSVADIAGRIRVAADRIDGGKPRDASGGEKAQAPNGGPLQYDLNRRANDIRAWLQTMHDEMLRLEAAIGTEMEETGRGR